MLVLDREQTRLSLPYEPLIDALSEAFQQDITSPLRHHHKLLGDSLPESDLLLMPAWSIGGYGGVKMVNVVPGNADKGLPSVASTYILFDRSTGQHLMLLDGGELTARRTAAASSLAAKHLARKDSAKLLIVGTGRVGRELAYAYRAAIGINKVILSSRTLDSAERLGRELSDDGFEIECVTSIDAGIEKADIVSAATLAKLPILHGARLRPGQHIDLIGSFTPNMREADDEVIRRGTLFVDTPHALIESGDLQLPLRSGLICEDDIAGTLSDLCRQRGCGRTDPKEITVFKSVGSAVEDLAAAVLAYTSQAA